jgi:hypothetical protein
MLDKVLLGHTFVFCKPVQMPRKPYPIQPKLTTTPKFFDSSDTLHIGVNLMISFPLRLLSLCCESVPICDSEELHFVKVAKTDRPAIQANSVQISPKTHEWTQPKRPVYNYLYQQAKYRNQETVVSYFQELPRRMWGCWRTRIPLCSVHDGEELERHTVLVNEHWESERQRNYDVRLNQGRHSEVYKFKASPTSSLCKSVLSRRTKSLLLYFPIQLMIYLTGESI